MAYMDGKESNDRPAEAPREVEAPEPVQSDRVIAEPGEVALSEGRKGVVALPHVDPGNLVNKVEALPAVPNDPPPPAPNPAPPSDSE